MPSIAFIAIASLVPSLVTCLSATASFKTYGSQSGLACGSTFKTAETQSTGVFSASLNDFSGIWEGTECAGTKDASKCTGAGACKDCTAPVCDDMQSCGRCHNVKCVGAADGSAGACTGDSIRVMIVDACAASNPANYCKTPEFGGSVAPAQACQGLDTQLEISSEARAMLSSFKGNLLIDVSTVVAC